jgi:hypothetical protein
MGRFESKEGKDVAPLECLLAATSEVAVAQEVAIYHDIARVCYPFWPNKVESFEDFTSVISNYYSYHYSRCCGRGELMSWGEISNQAVCIVEEEYRNRGGDISAAYKDARDGTSGGLMVILDRIAEYLKSEEIERYIQNVFEKCISEMSRNAKAKIIRQFIARHDQGLPSSILNDPPEKYVDNYHELIKAYVKSLKESRIFRILPPPSEVG